MSGIGGWFGRQQSDLNSVNTLESMSQTLCSGERQSISDTLYGSDSLSAITACKKNSSIYKNNHYLVAISGHPVFMGIKNIDALARALAQQFETKGKDILKELHGPFCLAIIDSNKKSVLLAIDRIGVESLMYSIINNTVVFGSRADTVSAHPFVSNTIDPQSIFNYLYFHCIPSPECIYKNIYKLLPGQCIQYQNGSLEKYFYWEPEYLEPTNTNEADLSNELLERLESSVNKCLDNSPTATFLSGGLDSSTVTTMFAKISEDSVNAYSIGFDAKGYDEMEYARASAHHCNANLNEYYVTPEDVTNAIPKIAAAYDEPFGNASAIPAYYCALAAKQNGIKVMLAGDGGDELFAGNARYAKQALFNVYNQIPNIVRNFIVEPIFLNLPLSNHISPLRKIKSYIEQACIPMPERLETYNFMHRSPMAEILNPEFLSSINPERSIENLRETYSRSESASFLKRMLHLDLKFTLADNDLRKVNRMCELADVEVRYPMLDEDLVNFSARVPSKLLLDGQELRAFYRKSLQDILASSTLDKSKQGFGLPFGIWMSQYAPLQKIAYDSLSSIKQRGFFNAEYIDQLINEHRSGHAAYYGVMIWVIMMLEQWLQKH